MFDLSDLYSGIAARGFAAINAGKEQVDPWLRQMQSDPRMGLTLLIRLPTQITDQIMQVNRALQKIEPEQYYYPMENLHITVLTLLGAKPGLTYTDNMVSEYAHVIEYALSGVSSISTEFRGIIPSDSAIMVKGYYDRGLEQIRQHIRAHLRKKQLPLNERYETKSCHITSVRFRAPLQNRKQLVDLLSRYSEFHFGSCEVTSLQFVYHDWYDSRKTLLKEFILYSKSTSKQAGLF